MGAPDTAERILTVFMEMAMRQGVRSLTMDDVAARLGISKKTLYQHFATKEDLVVAGLSGHIAWMQQQYEEIKTQAADPIQQCIDCVVCDFEHLSNVNPALPQEISKYFPQAWRVWEDFDRGYMFDYLMANVTWGVSEGYYRADIDIEFAVRFQIAAMQGVVASEFVSPTRYGFQRIIRHGEYMFIRGISTAKGIERFEQLIAQLPSIPPHSHVV
jgi:AcrR family transcriptional regulator